MTYGKLIFFIIVLVGFALFMSFNVEHRCDVSLVFYTFQAVPITLSLLFAFACGALTALLFLIDPDAKTRKQKSEDSPTSAPTGGVSSPEHVDVP